MLPGNPTAFPWAICSTTSPWPLPCTFSLLLKSPSTFSSSSLLAEDLASYLTDNGSNQKRTPTDSIHPYMNTGVCYVCCVWYMRMYVCTWVPLWVCTGISTHSLPSCLLLWMNCLRLILCLFKDIALEILSHSDQFPFLQWIIPINEEISWQVSHLKKSSFDPASVFSYHPISLFPLTIRLLEQLVCIAVSKSFPSILC